MSEPTPGPWEVEGSIYRGMEAAVSGGEPRRTIAQVPRFADARLIAAARELLEALKQVGNAYGCFAGCTASLVGPGECADHNYSCKVARSAIAKAEGR